ncbi:MAG: Crp/Fnr family transcriptional regulator [Myxococcota bacterium]
MKEKLSKLVQKSPAGTILFRDGDAGDDMYVIQQGRVRIYTEVRAQEKQLAILGPGDFFGEMALLNNKPRTASASILEDATLLRIDAQTFGSMIVSNTEIAVRLIRKLARRLDSANTLIDLLMHRDPKARVILGLAHEAEFNGQTAEDGSVIVPLDIGGLSKHIGLTDDEVNAVLRRLDRLQIVQQTESGFRIPDVMRLHEFLEFLQMREKFGDV